MASRRGDNIPVVSRKIPTELTTNTLYGTVGIRSKFCPKCCNTRSISSFYMRSPDYSKEKPYNVLDPVERLCVECRDDQTRKRRQKQSDYIVGSTLDRFFDE
jgi:hypothetical protein